MQLAIMFSYPEEWSSHSFSFRASDQT